MIVMIESFDCRIVNFSSQYLAINYSLYYALIVWAVSMFKLN